MAHHPDRRQRFDRRKSHLWGIALGIFIFIVISTGALIVGRDGQRISERGQKAICVEIKYIEGASVTNRKLVSTSKTAQEKKTRIDAANGALRLAHDLRALGINCD